MLALNSTMGLSACGWLFAINLPQYKISANMRQTIVIRSTPRVQNLNINLSSGLVEVVSSRSLATRMNVIKQISNHLVEINALKASQHILINGKFEIHWRAYRFRSFFWQLFLYDWWGVLSICGFEKKVNLKIETLRDMP